MTLPWVAWPSDLVLVVLVLLWGKWPQIRARHPKIQAGIKWVKEPLCDGMLITIRSEIENLDGFFIAYFGGPAKIAEVRTETPSQEGTLVCKLDPAFSRSTKSEILVALEQGIGPSSTVILKLLASDKLDIIMIRYLRPGDREKMVWLPLR